MAIVIFEDKALVDGTALYTSKDVYRAGNTASMVFDPISKLYRLSHINDDNELFLINGVSMVGVNFAIGLDFSFTNIGTGNAQIGVTIRHNGLARPNEKGYTVRAMIIQLGIPPNYTPNLDITRENGGIAEDLVIQSPITYVLGRWYTLRAFVYTDGLIKGVLYDRDTTLVKSTVSIASAIYPMSLAYDEVGIHFAYDSTATATIRNILLTSGWIAPTVTTGGATVS